jgi:hypothetical protein
MATDYTGQILAHAPVRVSPNMQFPKVLACNCECGDELEATTEFTLTFAYGAIHHVTALAYDFKDEEYSQNLNEDASSVIISDNDEATFVTLLKRLRALFGQFLQGNGNVDIDITTTPGTMVITVSAVAAKFTPLGIFIDGVLVAFV